MSDMQEYDPVHARHSPIPDGLSPDSVVGIITMHDPQAFHDNRNTAYRKSRLSSPQAGGEWSLDGCHVFLHLVQGQPWSEQSPPPSAQPQRVDDSFGSDDHIPEWMTTGECKDSEDDDDEDQVEDEGLPYKQPEGQFSQDQDLPDTQPGGYFTQFGDLSGIHTRKRISQKRNSVKMKIRQTRRQEVSSVSV